jgi:hypothetical protein
MAGGTKPEKVPYTETFGGVDHCQRDSTHRKRLLSHASALGEGRIRQFDF